MFELAARLRHLSRRGEITEAPEEADRKKAIRLLLITRDDELYFFVHNVAIRCGWEIRLARTVEESVRLLNEFTAPLIIYDWVPLESDWRLVVDRLAARPEHLCILLASPVVDQYLWAELVRHGGFEIIPRSADMDELIRIVRFARRSSDVRRGRTFSR